jgi:hypothetical protein
MEDVVAVATPVWTMGSGISLTGRRRRRMSDDSPIELDNRTEAGTSGRWPEQCSKGDHARRSTGDDSIPPAETRFDFGASGRKKNTKSLYVSSQDQPEIEGMRSHGTVARDPEPDRQDGRVRSVLSRELEEVTI